MLSYSRGHDAPLIESTIYEVFSETARTHAAKDALIVRHQQARLTYQELLAATERTARGLAGLGIGAGDRVGLWSTNCTEWMLLLLACARVGAVLVNVNPAYRAYELRYVLRKSRMKALFLWDRDHRTDYRAILEEARDQEDQAPVLAVSICSDFWSQMFEHGVDVPVHEADPDAVINIQYTSGTTGSPKGVLLTHRNLLNNGVVIAAGMNIRSHDIICAPVPMYHCFGCVGGIMVALVTGAALLMPAATFDPLATMRATEEYRATVIYGVPTMFIAQFDHPEFDRIDFSSLRTGVMAGAPCPVEIMKRVVHAMNCPEMTIMYGQTESSPVITMSSVNDSLDKRVSTVGGACPNTEVKIVDPATGDTVPVGVIGELCTRGYLVMKGYDGDPDATAKAIDEDGWLHTGDLASMREDEYFNVTGRARDLIIRGGENISPREVEEFLYTHPAIADVVVFGIPDLKFGEIVGAWIRLRPGEAASAREIQDYSNGRIAHFKIPQFIRFVDEFPMTVTGKTQKYKMREFEVREQGLESAANVHTA